jgi:hypothetical protein
VLFRVACGCEHDVGAVKTEQEHFSVLFIMEKLSFFNVNK